MHDYSSTRFLRVIGLHLLLHPPFNMALVLDNTQGGQAAGRTIVFHPTAMLAGGCG